MRVVLRNVCKDIKGARVLDNVNLELESGMVYGFKGKNGSGKTMLARRLPTILPPMTIEEALETTKIHAYACYKRAYKSEG